MTPAPALLVETPRGGPFGHRFLMPPAVTLRTSEVEAYFQRAAQGQGKDFIAVSRQVEQNLPNGSVRQGTETLLLAGLDTSALEETQRHRIRQLLSSRLADLEKLVTSAINWQEAGRQTLVTRSELADWLDGELTGLLAPPPPPSPGSPPPRHTASPAGQQIADLIGILLGLAAGAIILFCWFF